MSEFLHHVVKKRERDEEYRTLRIERPRIGLPTGLVAQLRRDMEDFYARMNEGRNLVNIDGSVYVRQSSVSQLTDSTRRHLSQHAQWFDSDLDMNSADHAHRWVLDYATQGEVHRLYHYSCADCGRQIQASVTGG